MNKESGHVEDRAKERTTLTQEEIQIARAYVKKNRKRFLKGKTYSIAAPGRKGYYIVGDVGEGRKKHVIKTVYGVNMRPPGTVIQNALLERELVKAAEALFTLEKTASVVAVSLAELNFEKAASAYLGYSWEDWQTEDPYIKEAMLGTINTMFQGARGFVNRKGADLLSRVGVSNTALAGSRQQAAKSYSQYAKGLENQAQNMATNRVGGTGKTLEFAKSTPQQIAAKQTQAAQASARAAQQGRMGAQGMTGTAAQSEMAIAKAQQGHANRQLNMAAKETNLADNVRAGRSNLKTQQAAVADAEAQLASASTRSAQQAAQKNLAAQQKNLQSAQATVNTNSAQLRSNREIRQMASSGTPAPKPPPPTPTTPSPTTTTPSPTTTPNPTTTTKPTATTPTTTPEVAEKGLSMKQLGYGALGGAALAGGGYMGYKALTAPPQGPYPGQQKLANWYNIRERANSASEALQHYKEATVEYRGKTFPGYNQPIESDKEGKKKMVLAKKKGEVKLVHFGQDGYKHNYSKSAKKDYLTRSAGIRDKEGNLTKNDPHSPNYWSRKVLWPKKQEANGSALKMRK